MLDFIATPFMVLAHICLWVGSLINGKSYYLMEVSYEEDEEGSEDDY
jgi:hypothetical protein